MIKTILTKILLFGFLCADLYSDDQPIELKHVDYIAFTKDRNTVTIWKQEFISPSGVEMSMKLTVEETYKNIIPQKGCLVIKNLKSKQVKYYKLLGKNTISKAWISNIDKLYFYLDCRPRFLPKKCVMVFSFDESCALRFNADFYESNDIEEYNSFYHGDK